MCRACFFLVFFGLGIAATRAQTFVEIKGVAVRADSLTPIYGAVVYNKNRFLGTLTNKNGAFKMRIQLGDTLQISHLGFFDHYLVFDHLDFDPNEKFYIALALRTYELPTIDVLRFRIRPKPQAPFSLMRTDNLVINTQTMELEHSSPYRAPTKPTIRPSNDIVRPSQGLGIPDFKELKRQEQLEQIARLERTERKRNYLKRKYNKQFVHELTGLKGNELEQFMNFCKPTDKMVFEADEYELTYFVLNCYENFRLEND